MRRARCTSDLQNYCLTFPIHIVSFFLLRNCRYTQSLSYQKRELSEITNYKKQFNRIPRVKFSRESFSANSISRPSNHPPEISVLFSFTFFKLFLAMQQKQKLVEVCHCVNLRLGCDTFYLRLHFPKNLVHIYSANIQVYAFSENFHFWTACVLV